LLENIKQKNMHSEELKSKIKSLLSLNYFGTLP
jgi:hypothetical protein